MVFEQIDAGDSAAKTETRGVRRRDKFFSLTPNRARRGREEIEERYAADLASYPSKQSFKLLQVCAVGDAICAISEFFHYNTQTKGHYAAIYVREGDTWKIRMAYAQ